MLHLMPCIEGEVPVPQITHRDLVAFANDRVSLNRRRHPSDWLERTKKS
jgi:hypothetical protein